MGSDDLRVMREKVAEEYKLSLYRQYSEKQAAAFIGLDYSTLKRKRLAGLVPYVDKGGGSIAYLGFQMADIILFGVNAKTEGALKPPDAPKPVEG